MKSFTPVSNRSKTRTFLASFLTGLMLVAPLTPAALAATRSPLLNQAKGAQKARPQTGTAKNSPGKVSEQSKTPGVTQSIAASDITATKTDTVTPDSLGD